MSAVEQAARVSAEMIKSEADILLNRLVDIIEYKFLDIPFYSSEGEASEMFLVL